jgi:hypothetical protein
MGQNLTGKLISNTYEDLVQISGSVITNGLGVDINSLDILVSNATTAATASTTPNAVVTTSQPADDTLSFEKGDGTTSTFQINNVDNAVDAQTAISASFAQTASFALNVVPIATGSFVTTASISDATTTFTKADGSTFALTTNNVNNAVNALTASIANNTYIIVKNMEATQIGKGTPCYISASGTAGNIAGIYIADASNPLRMPAGVIAGADIASGEEGIGILNGFINGVNTSAFASGDEVFVAVGGGYTNVVPTGSTNLVQKLGNVEKAAANGSGVINMSGEARNLPNITPGYIWIGDANGVPEAIPSSSLVIVPFPYTGDASIVGQLQVTGSATIQSASFNGDLIDNLTTPTASDAVKHVVAISSEDYSNLAVVDPNTFYIINDITGSLVLGDTVVSGSLTVTGALNAPGLIVPSASYAQTASLAFFADAATSASYALTASYLEGGIPTTFPFTGSAGISGSLDVVGPITSGDGTQTVGTNGNEVCLGGDNNSATGNKSAAIGGEYHNVSGFRAGNFAGEANTNTGTNTAAIGGYNNQVGGTYGAFAGGAGNNIGGTSYFVGGTDNSQGSGYIYAMLGGNYLDCQTDSTLLGGGENNTSISGHRKGAIIGGEYNVLNGSDTDRSVIFGGFTNKVETGSTDSAVIAGRNNIVLHSGSVVIGGDGLASTDNHQVVVPKLLISGSGGGVTFPDGTTQTTAASIEFNPITNLYNLMNDVQANTVQTLDVNTGGLYDLHISASGLYGIDASTIGATSASVNIYFYLDSFTSGSQAAWYATLNSGSGTGIAYRTIVSSSSGEYYAGGAALGGTTTNFSKNASKKLYQIAGGSSSNPAIITVFSDGRKAVGNGQTPLASASNFIASGNQGTPIT